MKFIAAFLASYFFVYTSQAAFGSESCGQITSEITCGSAEGCTYLNGACKCTSNVKLDILFAVDTSASIGFGGFQIQKHFIRRLVDNDISDSARIGFIMFSTTVNMSRGIQDWPDKDTLTEYVDFMYWTAGWTNTPDLLNVSIQEFDRSHDPDRQQILVLITDGNPCLPGECPQSVCNQAPLFKLKGIRVIIIGVGDELNPKYVQCLCQSDDDFFPVSSFSDENFDAILGPLSDVLCPIIKQVKITEVKAHKVTSAQNFRMQRFVEGYSSGINFDLSELSLSGLVSTSGTFVSGTTINQGQYLVFYDAANSAGTLNGFIENKKTGVVSCHLCPSGIGQCDLSECGANDIGNANYTGYCWCQNSIYVACGNTESSTCNNLPTNNTYGPNVIDACSICTFNDAMSKSDWNITISDNAELFDAVVYDSDTWILADDGYSYELTSNGFDNDVGYNWRQSCNQLGTPGADPVTKCDDAECIPGGCGDGPWASCNSGTKQCDCVAAKNSGYNSGLYPMCLDKKYARGCSKCGKILPPDGCVVTYLRNGTSIFNWTQTERDGFTKYKITYFQGTDSNFDVFEHFTYSNLFVTNDYDPSNDPIGVYLQTAVVECTECGSFGCDPACDPALSTCNCDVYFSEYTNSSNCAVVTPEPTSPPTSAPTIPTQPPTLVPSLTPTSVTIAPTLAPTIPTQDPTSTTIAPTQAPSQSPSSAPTVSSLPPTMNPSPSPTNVKSVNCGKTTFIEYIESESNGQLAVNIDYEGMILFNATSANVQIDDIQVYNLQNIRVDEGEFDKECQCIQLYIAFKGRYQFIFVAENDAMIRIDVKCTSANPTQLPTAAPLTSETNSNTSVNGDTLSLAVILSIGTVLLLSSFFVFCFVLRKKKKQTFDNDAKRLSTTIEPNTEDETTKIMDAPHQMAMVSPVPGSDDQDGNVHNGETELGNQQIIQMHSLDTEDFYDDNTDNVTPNDETPQDTSGVNGEDEEGSSKYQRVGELLEAIYGDEYQNYLDRFRQEMVTDQKLFNDDQFRKIYHREHQLWKRLIDGEGARYDFFQKIFGNV